MEAELRVIAATLSLMTFAAISAHAFPVALKASPVELGIAPPVELVRDGCGHGYHRTRWQDGWGYWHWGRCVPNWWGKGAFLPD